MKLSQLGLDISSQVTRAEDLSKVAMWVFVMSLSPVVSQLIWLSPSAAPTVEEAWAPTSVYLSEKVAIATFRFLFLREQDVNPSPNQVFAVRSIAPLLTHDIMYESASWKRASPEYEPLMPPNGSPLAPFVVFSLEIFTPDMDWVLVFSQISP
jgi:hypothetical protein